MKSSLAITIVPAIGLLLAALPAAAEEPGIPQDILKAMERYVGDWRFEGTEIDQPVNGFVTYRWAPGRHCLLWDMQYTNAKGTFLGSATVAWDPLRQQLVERDYWPDGNWNRYTYTVKPNVWTGEAEQVQPNGDIQKGTLTEEIRGPDEFVWRLFKSGTSAEQASEIGMLHFRKLPPTTPELLQEYGAAMVGKWQAEILLVADVAGVGKKGERVEAKSNITWLFDKQGLLMRMENGGVSDHWVAFWDPESRRIRVTGVSSLGSVFEGRVDKEGDTWVCRFASTTPDGTKSLGNDTMIISDAGMTHTHVGSDVFRDAVRQPDYRDVWKRVSSTHP